MKVRYAGPHDLDTVYNYAEPYARESGLGEVFEFSPTNAWNTFWGALNDPDYYVLLAQDEGEVTGLAIVATAPSFWEGREGDIELFFIQDQHRGSGSSRALVKECVELYKRLGLNVLYGGAASFLGGTNNNLYVNLFKKFGFKITGSIVHYAEGL